LGEEVRVAVSSTTYITVDPEPHDFCGVLEIFLLGLLRFTERSGVSDTAVVLV
jgi:hypothetical protein